MALNDSQAPGGEGRILLEFEGPIAPVTLSHPGRLNAITVHMWRELARVFGELSADETLRCVVLRGDGGNFAAGAVIRDFPRQPAALQRVILYLTYLSTPAIRDIRG